MPPFRMPAVPEDGEVRTYRQEKRVTVTEGTPQGFSGRAHPLVGGHRVHRGKGRDDRAVVQPVG